MPDTVQQQQQQGSRSARTRYAMSCTECRRRKQKCNQGQPCSNCVRRFPQATCAYSARRKRPPASGSSSASSASSVKVVLEGDAYSHLDLAEVQDAILQVEGLFAAAGGENRNDALSAASVSQTRTSGLSIEQEGRGWPASSPGSGSRKVVVADGTGPLTPRSVSALLRSILQVRLQIANRIVNAEWGSIDSRQLLRAVQQAAQPTAMIGGLKDQLRNLPMAPTKLNMELVRIHLQLLSRFKASLDGNPDPESRFMKHWVPLSVKDPLLLQIVLYTAACFLNETGRIPKILVWAYKGGVHRMLNEHLSSAKRQTSDVAIMGAAQMVMDSWYWGTTAELRAHMAGLKTMIRMRGGLRDLGMGGFLAKTVLIHDISIALAHSLEPDLYGQPGFEFQDDFMVPYQVCFNSPLLSGWPPFLSPGSLRLHPSSARILDDMRSVIRAAVSLPPSPTTEDLRNVADAAVWALRRLNQMPANVPQQDGRQTGRYSEDRHGCNWQTAECDGAASSPDSYTDESTPPGQTTSEDSGTSPRSVRALGPPPDRIYRCVRITASIYYRAIAARVPTTEICSESEFLNLWELVWEVSVPTWKTAAGIFVWIMVAAVPSCHQTPPARFIKTLLVVVFMSIGLENWHVAIEAADAALCLQRWLRKGDPDDARADEKGAVGGENVVEKHGFILKQAAIPELADLQYDEDEAAEE